MCPETVVLTGYHFPVHLKSRLQLYVHALPKVRLIRTRRREGLIRARLLGVKEAVSPVVVFLDSHCECSEGIEFQSYFEIVTFLKRKT